MSRRLVACLLLVAGCGTSSTSVPVDDGGVEATTDTFDASTPARCPPCVDDGECGGGTCAQLGSDSVCVPRCPTGSECGTDSTCETITDTAGARVAACVPKGGVCGENPATDAGTVDSTPPVDAPPPPPPVDAGPVDGTVGIKGGKVSRLHFAAVGDTRPALPDDTKGYPTAIIDKIWADVASWKPVPTFVVATGDYCFASKYLSQGAAQLDLYLAARAKYSGTFFPALGNHECTGATASNCGTGNADGVTKTYQSFLDKMLKPIGQTQPWYSIRVDAIDGSWTSKFVFVAPNAWDAKQAAWLDGAMAEKTTYTFVVRHEPADATTAPGLSPSETILAKHPYTLKIVGHTHTYAHRPASKEVLFGNGGAPLSSGTYGFGLFTQRADGAIQVEAIDYASLASDAKFRFAVKADGTAAP